MRIRSKLDLSMLVSFDELDLLNASLMTMVELYRVIRDEPDIFGKFHSFNTFTELKNNFEFFEKDPRPKWHRSPNMERVQPEAVKTQFCELKVCI